MSSYLDRINEAKILGACIVPAYKKDPRVLEQLLRYQSALSQFARALQDDPSVEDRILLQAEPIVCRTEFYANEVQSF